MLKLTTRKFLPIHKSFLHSNHQLNFNKTLLQTSTSFFTTLTNEEDPYSIPDVKTNIKAFYVGRSINIAKAHREFCSEQPHRFKRDFIMISFPPPPPSTSSSQNKPQSTKTSSSSSSISNQDVYSKKANESAADVFGASHHQYEHATSTSTFAPKFGNKHIAVFNYGSVVFFNFNETEVNKKLNELRTYTTDNIPREFQITEDYTLAERSYLTEPCVLRNDLTILRELDFHSATVISTIMAQTVALDHFSMLVDQMLEIFTEFNMSVEKTGQFMAFRRNDLFKLVAQNNSVLIAVLSKLSLLERSDIAWKMPAYVHVWEGLREEFEINDRFNNLKYKLNLIQDNTKFFLEIMHNQKSNMLEWIIIILISAECVLMVMDICDLTPTKIADIGALIITSSESNS